MFKKEALTQFLFRAILTSTLLVFVSACASKKAEEESKEQKPALVENQPKATEVPEDKKAEATSDSQSQPATPQWSYAGETGPEKWGDLKEQYFLCKVGKLQSPIDLRWKKPTQKGQISFQYKPTDFTVVNTGDTVQVNFAEGNKATIHGVEYELVQMTFHSPSEHTFSGNSRPMELHLMHKGPGGKVAIVAVMLTSGAENPQIAQIWQNIPPKLHKATPVGQKPLDPSTLLPSLRTYYHYLGSLTIPPCTEGVSWNVFNTPIEVSKEQVEAFRKHYSGNNRPVQPTNGRKVQNY